MIEEADNRIDKLQKEEDKDKPEALENNHIWYV